MEEKRIKLYQKLKESQFYSKSYNEFINQFFDNSTNCDKLYNACISNGSYTKTKKEWYKSFACDLTWAETEPFCTSTTPPPTGTTPPPTGTTPSPTSTPTMSTTYVDTTATGQDIINGTLIKKGMKGDIVEKIQKYLNTHGASLKTDGKFGPKTKKAVELFQSKKNLNVDGVVGPKTWLELVKDPTITPKPSPTPIKPEDDDFKQETIYGSEENTFSFPSIIQTGNSTGYGD